MSAESISSSKGNRNIARAHLFVAGMTAIVAACLFIGTSSTHVEPEISAPLLAQLLHLAPFPSMEYPVWSWVVRFLAGLNVAVFPRTLNIFSALCGAFAALLLYRLIAASLRSSEVRAAVPWLAVASGLAASGFLVVCVPFWMVSNRAHPASFDLVLLLGSLRMLQLYGITRRMGWLLGFSFVYGVGLAELATFALFLPPIGFFSLYLIWRCRQFRARTLAPAILLGLLGASLLFLAAFEYFQLPAAKWREATSMWDVLKYFLLERRRLILGSIPRHGWLLLFMGTLVPWMMSWFAQRRNRGWEFNPSLLVFYPFLIGIALIVLFNGPVAPWRVMGLNPLLVTPYVLVASTYGLLLARLGTSIAARLVRKKRSTRGVVPALLVLALIPLALAGVRNAPIVSTQSSAAVEKLVQSVFDLSAGRSLWMGDGLLEPQLRLEAYRRGVSFNYVNAYQAEAFTYRRYLASLFDEPRLQSLALAGLGPLLSTWLGEEDTAVDQLALPLRPDIWLSEGLEPVPSGLLYLGARDRNALDPMQTWQKNVSFWQFVEPLLARLPTNSAGSRLLADTTRRQVARVANDLGVFMEYTGHPSEAVLAYRRSLSFDPENLSAALNLLVLAGEVDEQVDTSAAAALRDREMERPYPRAPQLLAIQYGHLRSRAAADLLSSGVPRMSPHETDPELAAINDLFANGQLDEARRRLERVLATSPESPDAWVMLAAIGYKEGQVDLVERSLRQMNILGQEWPILFELMGRMRLQQGDTAGARNFFNRALSRRPSDLSLLQQLLDLDLAAGDWNSVERLLNQILVIWPNHENANFALAALLRERKRLDLSENVLRQQLRARRTSRALAELADVVRQRGSLDSALEFSSEAVARLPQYARAHEVLGRVLMDLDRMPEAGEELQKARLLDPASVDAALALIDWYTRSGNVVSAAALAHGVLASSKGMTSDQERALREAAR